MSDEQSEIQGIEISFAGSTNISVHADFLLGSSATPSSEEEGISGTYEKNINGDGKLSLNWRSSQGGGLSAGQEVTVTKGGEVVGKYFLQENYVPSPNGDGTYTWSPTFIDSDSKMKGVIVYKEVKIYRRAVGSSSISTKSVDIYTFPYTGSAEALVTYLNTLASEAQVGSIVLGEAYQGDDVTVTVSFDQDNLVSACEKIASALGTQSTIEDGCICIGTHDAVLAVSEHYDRFIILGGTRNMGKYSLSNDDTYAAVTMRLTLPESLSPKSVVTLEGGSLVDCPSPYNTQLGQPYMTKVLIFDDIYPQMLLEIGDVRERICYLYDEEGHLMYVNETIDGQEVRKPKTYSKFYITLKLGQNQYSFNVKSVIEGRTLGIVFQDGLLCGREFDLSYYDLAESGRAYIDETNSDEDQIYYDDDDTEHLYPRQEWKAYDGEFRICMVADGDTLLPNHTLKPETGNHVTLTGVALDGQYEAEAKQRLAEEALPYVQLYMSTKAKDGEYESQVASNESEYVVDFLTGETIDVSPGDSINRDGSIPQEGVEGDYIVTSVTTDIKTGKQSVRYGTFEPQSRSMSNANNLETASVSEGGALIGQYNEEDYIRHTAAMGLDQFGALYEIYGHLGMKRVDTRFEGFTEEFTDMLDEVKEQTDQSFLIWYGGYDPLPSESNPSAEPMFPVTEWATNELKALHLQDVFYNTDRQPGTTGGRTWRWVREVLNFWSTANGDTITYDETTEKVTVNGTEYDVSIGELSLLSDDSSDDSSDDAITFTTYSYFWTEITDADTIASLEKLADVTNDGILSGGSEKSRIRTEWAKCVEEYRRYREQAGDYGLLSSVLSDSDSSDSSDDSSEEVAYGWVDYQKAFFRLGWMLNNGDMSESDRNIAIYATTYGSAFYYIVEGNTVPNWVNDANLDINTTISQPQNYRDVWDNYYAMLAVIVKLINDNTYGMAETALSAIGDMASDSKLDPVEKVEVKREFLSIWHEIVDSTGILDKATTVVSETVGVSESYHVDFIINYNDCIKPMIDAFNALGSYLNGDVEGDASAWNCGLTQNTILTAIEAVGVDEWPEFSLPSIPSWISGGIDTTNDIDAEEWQPLWSDLYAARSNAYTAMSDNALNHAETALEKIDDMASDDVLTAAEKQQVIREWEKVVEENEVLILKAQAANIGTDLTTYYEKSYVLYQIVNAMGTTPSTDNVPADTIKDIMNGTDPVDLYDTENDARDSGFNATEFTDAWKEYYSAAESLRAAISNIAIKFFVTEDDSEGVNLPTPPYNEGDIWLRKLLDGTYLTYTCVQDKGTGATAEESDWQLLNLPKKVTVREMLANLADLVYKTVNPATPSPAAPVLMATVTLSGQSPSISVNVQDVDSILATLKACLGGITFKIYYFQSPSSSVNLYDLVCTPVAVTIPGSNETIVGGITIKMCVGTSPVTWEYIQQSTSSLLNNLGTAINAVVFGSNQAAVEAAGMSIGQRYAQMFAQATIFNNGVETNLASAIFGLNVDYDRDSQNRIKYYDSNGNWSTTKNSQYTTPRYVSTAKLSAEKIDFEGKQITLTGQNTLTFSGGVISFTASTLEIDADQITWNGIDVIRGANPSSGTYDAETHSNFYVDRYNNVHMNNAYIKGTVVANAGKIGGASGWTIESQKLHGGGTLGQDDSMWLATTNLAGDIGGNEIQSSQIGTKGWRFTVGSKFGVLNDGTLVSENGLINGQLIAKSSSGSITIANGLITIEGTNGKMEFGFDSDGSPLMRYIDASENVLYGIGSSGISQISVRNASVTSVGFKLINDATYTPNAPSFQNGMTIFDLFKTVSSISDQLYLFKCQLINGQRTGDPEYASADSGADLADLDNRYYKSLAPTVPKILASTKAGGANGEWYYIQNQNDFGTNPSQIKVYNGYGTEDPDYTALKSTLYANYGGENSGGIMDGGWPMSSSDMSQNLLLYVECSKMVDGRVVKTYKYFMKRSYYESHKSQW